MTNRHWQFSLRTFIVVIIFACVIFGVRSWYLPIIDGKKVQLIVQKLDVLGGRRVLRIEAVYSNRLRRNGYYQETLEKSFVDIGADGKLDMLNIGDTWYLSNESPELNLEDRVPWGNRQSPLNGEMRSEYGAILDKLKSAGLDPFKIGEEPNATYPVEIEKTKSGWKFEIVFENPRIFEWLPVVKQRKPGMNVFADDRVWWAKSVK